MELHVMSILYLIAIAVNHLITRDIILFCKNPLFIFRIQLNVYIQ